MFQAEEKSGCVNANRVDSDGIHSCDQCNPLHHMLYPNDVNKSGTDSNHNLFPENESSIKMSSANDALMLHPDEVDMEIEQSEQREAPETIVANPASNLMPAPMPAAPPSLVKKMSENKEIRTLQARVEELVQSNESSNRRLAYAEMQISEQKRELISMKRRRLDSAGNSVSTSVKIPDDTV